MEYSTHVECGFMYCGAVLQKSSAACEVQRSCLVSVRVGCGHRRTTRFNFDGIALTLHCITKVYQ